MKDDLKTLISPALARCTEEGEDNLNEQILNGDIPVADVARVYKISEDEVMKIARHHRFWLMLKKRF